MYLNNFEAGIVVFLACLPLIAGCSDGSDGREESLNEEPAEPQFLIIADPTITSPPPIGKPLNFGIFDLAAQGYEEEEYFFSGTASAFTNLNELGSDGLWQVEAGEEADYTTRVLVRRPMEAASFNGTVLVEWLNVSAGFDGTPEWDNAHVEIVRDGYAWVGVTAQYVGVYGRENSVVPLNLKAINSERYEALEHPGDSFSYDIFSQVAQAIRSPMEVDILNGLGVERIIGSGYSQSAFRLVTYVNAIHPLYNPFDGYLISSRGAYAERLAQEPQTLIETPSVGFIRPDLNVPILVLQSETDILRHTLNFVLAREPDTDRLRIWEVAGTSHSDRYSLGAGWRDIGDDPSAAAVAELDNIQGFIQCDTPVNSGPLHYVKGTALNAMNVWIAEGVTPPTGEPLATSDDLEAFLLDDLGNVRGGVRTPYVDAPVAILSGLGQGGESFCGLFGTTILFSAEQMASLYIDKSGYVTAAREATEAAVNAGFLLAVDAEQIIAWAPKQWDSQVSP